MAEAQMARKYGAEAWRTMPHSAKVRFRLARLNYERHNRRTMWAAMTVPAVVASVIVQVIAAILRCHS
jgi:hypothetical protein